MIGGVTIQRERFPEFYAEAGELMREHDQEVGSWELPYHLDLPHYRNLDRSGQLFILTARHYGHMVGYVMFKLARHPHYPVMVAFEDAHFVTKSYRKGLRSCWWRLVKAAKQLARENGASAFVIHEKETKPIGKLLGLLGFRKTDSLWMEWL